MRIFALLAAVLLAACGGGGGSGTPPPPPAPVTTMSVSPLTLSVTASLSDPAPSRDISVSFTTTSSTPITAYIGGRYSTNGIASTASNSDGTTGFITLTFKSPAAIGVGTYNDTVTITGCPDQACTSQFGGSPQNVAVQYIVTAVPPFLASINPTAATAGGNSFTLTATGSNFTSQSAVQWGGSALATTFVSSSQLTAVVPAALVATPTTVPITISGGPTTNSIVFTVEAPQPLALSVVSPTSVAPGSAAFILTVIGTGFNASSVVQWNGAPLATTLLSVNELQVQVPAANLVSAGSALVTVQNTNAPAGVSNAATVNIVKPLPDAVSFQITPAHSGVINFQTASLPSASTWSVDVGGTPSYALIAQGKVFLTVAVGNASELVALDQATGATVWGPILLSGNTNAAYDGGKIFVVNGNFGSAALMTAFDAGTGKQLWSTLLSGQYAFSAGPAALNGVVYTGGAGSGGTVFALGEANGATIWTQQVANGDDSTPAITKDGVYVSYPCQTYDLDPLTGTPIWTNSTGCDGGGGATGVIANSVYYSPNGSGSYDGSSFDAASGALLGSYVADVLPAVGTQTGFFLQSGTLRAIALNSNSVQWSFAGDGMLVTSPILVNQFVFVGSSSGNLYALDAASGVVQWTVNVGAGFPHGAGWGSGMPLTGLSAGDGLLIVPAGTKVTAYTLSTNP
jgi:outer membrane protein assembly factor BamB